MLMSIGLGVFGLGYVIREFDTQVRGWLSAAEFPRNIGNSFVNTMGKAMEETQKLGPQHADSYGFAQFAQLERAHGPALEDKLRMVGRMIDDLDRQKPRH